MKFAVFTDPVTTVYEGPAETKETEKGIVSAISDEALYGAVCRILNGTDSREGWVYQLSHYGYAGHVKETALHYLSEDEVRDYLGRRLVMVNCRNLDVLSLPTVQGVHLISLPGGAILEELAGERTAEGWTMVRLADGREGYVPSRHIEPKPFGEDYLWRNPQEVLENLKVVSARSVEAAGGMAGFSFRYFLQRLYGGDEDAFRDRLTAEAMKYLGTQYRWGGRSTYGIDCSGLVSMAYLRSGVSIYRDAAIAAGYPMERQPLVKEDGIFAQENLTNGNLRKGDALYFPGHIAMYIGDGKYIHSTARSGSNGVVINSLRPEDSDYREDLPRSIYAIGGLR